MGIQNGGAGLLCTDRTIKVTCYEKPGQTFKEYLLDGIVLMLNPVENLRIEGTFLRRRPQTESHENLLPKRLCPLHPDLLRLRRIKRIRKV